MNPKLINFLSHLNLALLGSAVSIAIESKKLRTVDQNPYNILKEDVVNLYKEKIDQSQKNPLIALLAERENELDPQLKRRLKVHAEWQKESFQTIAYKFGPIVVPIIIGSTIFPFAMALTSLFFVTAVNYNYSQEKQVITGGKVKSNWPKGLLPKLPTVEKYFTYLGYGILVMTIMKFGLTKYKLRIRDRVVDEWRKQQKK